MGDGTEIKKKSSAELQEEVRKRKEWFFECQLRRLNIATFREVMEKYPDPLLALISEPLFSVGFPAGQIGSRLEKIGQVYLDNQQPVWTEEIKKQKNVFAKSLLGFMGDWLEFKQPDRLAAKLADLKTDYEKSKYHSALEDNELNKYGRKDSLTDSDKLPHALSRMAIIEKMPWLIPEIFNAPNLNTAEVEQWVKNGETFIGNYENELKEVTGRSKLTDEPFNLGDPEQYREQMKAILSDSLTTNSSETVKVTFLDQSGDPWKFDIKIHTALYPLNHLQDYPVSDAVKYWTGAINNALKEIYVNKPDSDMGLCITMRMLYLHGTLPVDFGNEIRWRKRLPPTPDFHHFFAEKAKHIKENPELQDRLQAVQTKLQILLEETALSPHTATPGFSPLAQEVIKQDVLGYKFWMDEPFRAYDNYGNEADVYKLGGINIARRDLGFGDTFKKKKVFREMEYWSENHYIMFASSEYLAGQLWKDETFQAARDFVQPSVLLFEDKSKITGKQRMERGRARILKWLNNKLMFGWMEFNSSGYYREHLYALFNLVDFSLDKEVREKAIIVTDLLLFDAIRFSHKGSAGAAGGRSQFKSKYSGWDGALGDVMEICFGSRGIFLDESGEIGCFLSTTTYKIPDVLLQIGAYYPDTPTVDRSRVSITFEEAPKYGIDYSLQSDERDSLYEGFAAKRAKHFKFLANVNDEITRTHLGYLPWHDDTIFWWSMSAFYNKQVVKNTFSCVKYFTLNECPIFGEFLYTIVKYIMPALEKGENSVIGLAIGGLVGSGAGAALLTGAIAGFFADDVFGSSLIEKGSDDLSLLLEGSTRTRANIHTYRNRDVMLSSLQNFRHGQFNFQTNVNQATLNTSVNVFTTAAFAGIDLSSIKTALAGGLLGLASPLGYIGAVVGVAGGILVNEIGVENEELLVDKEDGPYWWTGYWALPMIVQYESTAIIAYDFTGNQKELADVASHVWFPKNGFDQTQERRSSAYEDDNLFLLDIMDAGPKGFWLFGKMVHKRNFSNPELDEEGYIGVFSNQRPEWLTKDSDFYKDHIESELEKEPAWDFFAEKDWYVSGKNIWIMQVGNKDEFGNFDNFKDRLSKAKVVIDDAGDMECSYSIPLKDGSSKTLTLNYEDGGKFSLDGNGFQTDLYPRFENKFIRGGLVEWGQREYIIEYNGSSLLHYFNNFEEPFRLEDIKSTAEDLNIISALVIYLKTGEEEMELWSVAEATVKVGCDTVATDDVIAAGEVSENTSHDVEWIFFENNAALSPDMTIDIKHPRISRTGNDDPEWKMTFKLRALLGDRTLRDCTLSFSYCHFHDEHRSTGPLPFALPLDIWHPWAVAEQNRKFKNWQIALQPEYDTCYYNYSDIVGVDESNRLWHRQLQTCPDGNSSWVAVSNDARGPNFANPYFLCSISTQPGNLFLFVVSEGKLFFRMRKPRQGWNQQLWNTISLETISKPLIGIPGIPVPVILFPLSQVVVQSSSIFAGGIDICVNGADGNYYSLYGWLPGSAAYYRITETMPLFMPLWNAPFELADNFLFSLDVQHRLWVTDIGPLAMFSPGWQKSSPDWMSVVNFTVAHKGNFYKIIVTTNNGEVWASGFTFPGDTMVWERVGVADNFLVSPQARVSWAIPVTGRLDIFVCGTNGKVYTTWWREDQRWEKGHNWRIVSEGSDLFENGNTLKISALSRVQNLVEIYTEARDGTIWKSWWS